MRIVGPLVPGSTIAYNLASLIHDNALESVLIVGLHSPSLLILHTSSLQGFPSASTPENVYSARISMQLAVSFWLLFFKYFWWSTPWIIAPVNKSDSQYPVKCTSCDNIEPESSVTTTFVTIIRNENISSFPSIKYLMESLSASLCSPPV